MRPRRCKQLLDEASVISGIIKIEVSVISRPWSASPRMLVKVGLYLLNGRCTNALSKKGTNKTTRILLHDFDK